VVLARRPKVDAIQKFISEKEGRSHNDEEVLYCPSLLMLASRGHDDFTRHAFGRQKGKASLAYLSYDIISC